MAMLTAPVDGASRKAESSSRSPKVIERPEVDTKAFRYGPDVNHGRSDTPVHAAAAARKQAKSGQYAERKRPRIVVRPTPNNRPAPGMALKIQPSISSSGH